MQFNYLERLRKHIQHLKIVIVQWSAVRVTPSGSEFLKNRGRYHKMVLGHHRWIS